MSKKPWEDKVDDDWTEEYSRSAKGENLISTPFLTGILGIFFVVIVVILVFFLYTSTGGSNKQASSQSSSSQSSVVSSSSTSASSSQEEASSSTEASSSSTEDSSSTATSSSSTTPSSNGGTITVNAGEGPASIAARAGISLDQLYALNPDHMTTGSWYANPGDEVYVN
ncbi:SAG1386/EF1546 family surface-associated protein [Streptococcus sp. DD12]|uniref:SAG1386/EF1546 family surface-associated protein n=1 Tax=Streptococcus sp. DD12 TaxID=1777880 RepID=UPI000796F465|nr:SAG1386/EF1546 family surface-associated protein [Streptococcus sp. DD12]KXT76407.1 hypothetical protein STRDD12_00586 [Streptococcus sp. DD12]